MATIIYEGDYIRDVDGVVSKVKHIQNWDDEGDADVYLENGRVINSRDVTDEMVLLESEVEI